MPFRQIAPIPLTVCLQCASVSGQNPLLLTPSKGHTWVGLNLSMSGLMGLRCVCVCACLCVCTGLSSKCQSTCPPQDTIQSWVCLDSSLSLNPLTYPYNI